MARQSAEQIDLLRSLLLAPVTEHAALSAPLAAIGADVQRWVAPIVEIYSGRQVYFARRPDGSIKIGSTTCVRFRMETLRLVPELIVDASGYSHERLIHSRLQLERVGSEIFRGPRTEALLAAGVAASRGTFGETEAGAVARSKVIRFDRRVAEAIAKAERPARARLLLDQSPRRRSANGRAICTCSICGEQGHRSTTCENQLRGAA